MALEVVPRFDSSHVLQTQVSIILAALSIEFEFVQVVASVTQTSLDMLTEMFLNCETRQLEIVTDVPIQVNLINRQKDDSDNHLKQDSSSGYSRNYNQGFKHKGESKGTYGRFTRSRPQC
ncbi:hypothetical protein PVK06_001580 [Gossypium arboreum]|uniref:Uncharacterized protein n=1 Tax=Gossypium arboreum TaxID=29729 RepID=A0ABR0R1D9_GOSAR|nr:hypothetical protein PVK06_001580 [Gossypium arboreum]